MRTAIPNVVKLKENAVCYINALCLRGIFQYDFPQPLFYHRKDFRSFFENLIISEFPFVETLFFYKFTSSIVYASISSPSLMSLNPSRFIPHSYPCETSLTSSLNLRRDASFPSQILFPSRSNLKECERAIFPFVT